MRLLSCHIENFGVLHDFTMEFDKEIHLLHEENGFGKSTLADFIKVMFYGFRGANKRSIEDNERKKYKPWQGGVYGGSLDFVIGGKEYRLLRLFGEKEAGDEFELRDRKTNLISGDYSEKIGEEIFKINRESFERTVFVGQKDCETFATDDINAKIGSPIDCSGDMNCYDRAVERLTQAMNRLNPGRSTGSIARRKAEIEKVQRIVREGTGIEETLENYEKLLLEKKKEYDELCIRKKTIEQEQRMVYKEQEALAKRSRLQELENKVGLLELTGEEQKELEELCRVFSTSCPTEREIHERIQKEREFQEICREYEMQKLSPQDSARLEEMRAFFCQDCNPQELLLKWNRRTTKQALLVSQRDTLQTWEKEQKNKGRQKKEEGLFLSALSIVSILAGIGLMVMEKFAMAVFFGALGIFILAFLLWRIRNTARRDSVFSEMEKLRERILEEEAEIEEAEEEGRAFLESLSLNYEEDRVVQEITRLLGKKEEYLMLEKKASLLRDGHLREEMEIRRDELISFLGKYDIDAEAASLRDDLYFLKDQAKRYVELKGKQALLKKAEEEVLLYKQQEGLTSKEEVHLPSLTGLNQIHDRLTCQMEELQKHISSYQRSIEHTRERYEEWEESREYLEELIEKQKQETAIYQNVKNARLKLMLAKEVITEKYADPLLASFEKYYEKITNKVEKGFHVDAHIHITVDGYGKQREVSSLSRGYRDLVGLCLRFALIDAMYPEEAPFILLDDPFVNLDDEKLKGAKAFLEEVSQRYQILYFSCSEARCRS